MNQMMIESRVAAEHAARGYALMVANRRDEAFRLCNARSR
jgi:hypothetical protein